MFTVLVNLNVEILDENINQNIANNSEWLYMIRSARSVVPVHKPEPLSCRMLYFRIFYCDGLKNDIMVNTVRWVQIYFFKLHCDNKL